MHDHMVNEPPERPADPWAGRLCSLEELAERIASAIAGVAEELRLEVAAEGAELDLAVIEAVVRGWIAGLEPRARAHFLTVALSGRAPAECPAIARAIRDGRLWPAADSSLDPSCDACEAGADAARHDVPRRAGAGRV